MKAGVVHAREDIRYEEIEKPVPKKESSIFHSATAQTAESVDQIFHVSTGMHAIPSRMYWDMNSQEQ